MGVLVVPESSEEVAWNIDATLYDLQVYSS